MKPSVTIGLDPAGRTTPGKPQKTRILLVDDHPLMRRGLRALIDQQSDYEVCAEADDAPHAIEMVRKWSPDVAIVDITLQSANGIELTKSLRGQSPAIKIMVVTMHPEELYAERALRAGASGYLMKHEAADRVIAALDCILQGKIYISERLRENMLHRLVSRQPEQTGSDIGSLSDREVEVLQLIGNGHGTRAIATQLRLSVKTVDSYREHLKAKMNLKSGSELVRYAIQWMKSQDIV